MYFHYRSSWSECLSLPRFLPLPVASEAEIKPSPSIFASYQMLLYLLCFVVKGLFFLSWFARNETNNFSSKLEISTKLFKDQFKFNMQARRYSLWEFNRQEVKE